MKKSVGPSPRMTLNQAIEEVYKGRQGRRIKHESAVLLPLIEEDGSLSLLYEVRSYQLSSQPGEVCFPGGRMEGHESSQETAVRETCEELLIKPEAIEVIGGMDSFELGNGAIVWPYIGKIKGSYSYSQDEVDHLFKVPLTWLCANIPQQYKLTQQTIPDPHFPIERLPGGKDYQWLEKTRDVYMYLFQDEVIWGLTANITHAFIESIKAITF